MTAYVVRGWCRICQARTLLSRVTQPDPATREPVSFTVCTDCGEQVGQTGSVRLASPGLHAVVAPEIRS